MKTLLLVLTFVFVGPAFAKTAKVAKPLAKQAPHQIRVPTSVASSNGFKFEVNFGEKRTHFLVWEDAKGKYFAANNSTRSNVGNLTPKNYDFLKKQSTEISTAPETSIKTCPGNNMRLVKGDKPVRTACIGTKTATAVKMTEMANILALLI